MRPSGGMSGDPCSSSLPVAGSILNAYRPWALPLLADTYRNRELGSATA
jgi:hypothetical protein